MSHAEKPYFVLQLHMVIETPWMTLQIPHTAAGMWKAQCAAICPASVVLCAEKWPCLISPA